MNMQWVNLKMIFIPFFCQTEIKIINAIDFMNKDFPVVWNKSVISISICFIVIHITYIGNDDQICL